MQRLVVSPRTPDQQQQLQAALTTFARLAGEPVVGKKSRERGDGIRSSAATPLQPVDLLQRGGEMSGWCADGWVKSVHNHLK
jgi:hypothetical protein